MISVIISLKKIVVTSIRLYIIFNLCIFHEILNQSIHRINWKIKSFGNDAILIIKLLIIFFQALAKEKLNFENTLWISHLKSAFLQSIFQDDVFIDRQTSRLVHANSFFFFGQIDSM